MEDDLPEVLFCSLGMFILDKIVYEDGSIVDDVIGGAGTYAAIGARVFAKNNEVGFIVDYGRDIEETTAAQIGAYGFRLKSRHDQERLCTRGLNTYRNGHREFEYLTNKLRLTPADLPLPLLKSRSFHFICSPNRCINMVEELRSMRRSIQCFNEPMIVWEPVPDACVNGHKDSLFAAMRLVDVLSPNEHEARNVLAIDANGTVEHIADQFYQAGASVVVIRCGPRGSFLRSKQESRWFPSLVRDNSLVVDATGAGNAFCGALAISLAQKYDINTAMVFASIAAGLCITQVGPPRISGTDTYILWNGKSVQDLLAEYDTS